MRFGARWWLALLVLVAAALHLPAHAGFQGGAAPREPLYEDGPALTANRAFDSYGTETFGRAVVRVWTDPRAAWSDGGGAVGRARWRPLASALALAERRALGARTAQGAAALSFLLHAAAIAAAMALARRQRLSAAGVVLAGAVVAAAPVALVSAAWPAQQAAVLAAALGGWGLVAGCSTRWAARAGGGVLLALAALSHEAAFALVPALALLQRGAPAVGGGARTWRDAWPAALAPAAALALRGAMHLSLASAVAEDALPVRGPGVLDGLAGALCAAGGALLPARLHFADGPWTTGIAGHAAAIAAVLLLAGALARLRPSPAGVLGSAAGAAFLLTAVAAAWTGGAPYHDVLLAVPLPLAGCAVAALVDAGSARGIAVRRAAAAAGALLVAASVAATAVRAPAFRTRAGHLERAHVEMPASAVVAAWQIDDEVTRAAAGKDPGADLRALAPRVQAITARVRASERPPLRPDRVAASSIAGALQKFAIRAIGAVPAGDELVDVAEEAAAASSALVPQSSQSWRVLALARERQGALGGAIEAIGRARAIDKRDLDLLETAVRLDLLIGFGEDAAFTADELIEAEAEAARAGGRRVRPQIQLLCARAMVADGRSRVRDTLGDGKVRVRYEIALDLLLPLGEEREVAAQAAQVLYDCYLLYGDWLASLDQTALATISYQRAMDLGFKDTPEAKEHAKWLQDRLDLEERAAHAELSRLQRLESAGPPLRAKPEDLVNALLKLGIAFARQAKFKEAEEVFAKLEEAGGMSPALRYYRAVHLYRIQDEQKARDELRLAVREDPLLARAHYELGRLLEEAGEVAQAAAAFTAALEAFERLAPTQGGEDWVLDARDRKKADDELTLRR